MGGPGRGARPGPSGGRVGVVTAFGRTLTPGEWERENGVPAMLIGRRIKLGWTPERAVGTPVRPRRRRDA